MGVAPKAKVKGQSCNDPLPFMILPIICFVLHRMDDCLGIPLSAALSTSATRDSLIVHYAKLGYSTKEICNFLNDVHGIPIR